MVTSDARARAEMSSQDSELSRLRAQVLDLQGERDQLLRRCAALELSVEKLREQLVPDGWVAP